MFSCKHRKISTGLLMSFLRQYCTVFSTTSSTVILSSSELLVDGVVGSEVSVLGTTKAFPELDAKEAAVTGANVMLLLCDWDCVVVKSGCVRVDVADPEVISSWLQEVLNAGCIKSFSSSSDSRDPS